MTESDTEGEASARSAEAVEILRQWHDLSNILGGVTSGAAPILDDISVSKNMSSEDVLKIASEVEEIKYRLSDAWARVKDKVGDENEAIDAFRVGVADLSRVLTPENITRIKEDAVRIFREIDQLPEAEALTIGENFETFAKTGLLIAGCDLDVSVDEIIELIVNVEKARNPQAFREGLYDPVFINNAESGSCKPAGKSSDICRVVYNLVKNAREAMMDRESDLPTGKVELGLRMEDGSAVITSSDTGPGMPPDKREAFNRGGDVGTSKEGDGGVHGLGLGIVRDLVARCGGTVTCESRPIADHPDDHGTTFTVRLPVAATPDLTYAVRSAQQSVMDDIPDVLTSKKAETLEWLKAMLAKDELEVEDRESLKTLAEFFRYMSIEFLAESKKEENGLINDIIKCLIFLMEHFDPEMFIQDIPPDSAKRYKEVASEMAPSTFIHILSHCGLPFQNVRFLQHRMEKQGVVNDEFNSLVNTGRSSNDNIRIMGSILGGYGYFMEENSSLWVIDLTMGVLEEALQFNTRLFEFMKGFSEQDKELCDDYEEDLNFVEQGVQKTASLLTDIKNWKKSGFDDSERHRTVGYLIDALEEVVIERTVIYGHNCVSSGKGVDIVGNDGVAMPPISVRYLADNLVDNAIAAKDPNRPLEVELRFANDVIDGRKYLRIEFSDNGVGMAPDVLARMKKGESYSTKGQFGSGQGIPIIFDIVKRAGGWVEVESEENMGTTFTMRLPLAATPDPTYAVRSAQGGAGASGLSLATATGTGGLVGLARWLGEWFADIMMRVLGVETESGSKLSAISHQLSAKKEEAPPDEPKTLDYYFGGKTRTEGDSQDYHFITVGDNIGALARFVGDFRGFLKEIDPVFIDNLRERFVSPPTKDRHYEVDDWPFVSIYIYEYAYSIVKNKLWRQRTKLWIMERTFGLDPVTLIQLHKYLILFLKAAGGKTIEDNVLQIAENGELRLSDSSDTTATGDVETNRGGSGPAQAMAAGTDEFVAFVVSALKWIWESMQKMNPVTLLLSVFRKKEATPSYYIRTLEYYFGHEKRFRDDIGKNYEDYYHTVGDWGGAPARFVDDFNRFLEEIDPEFIENLMIRFFIDDPHAYCRPGHFYDWRSVMYHIYRYAYAIVDNNLKEQKRLFDVMEDDIDINLSTIIRLHEYLVHFLRTVESGNCAVNATGSGVTVEDGLLQLMDDKKSGGTSTLTRMLVLLFPAIEVFVMANCARHSEPAPEPAAVSVRDLLMLGDIEPVTERTMTFLLGVVEGPNHEHKGVAGSAVYKICDLQPYDAFTALKAALKNEDAAIRGRAVTALSCIREPALRAEILELLEAAKEDEGEDKNVRRTAEMAIEEIEKRGKGKKADPAGGLDEEGLRRAYMAWRYMRDHAILEGMSIKNAFGFMSGLITSIRDFDISFANAYGKQFLNLERECSMLVGRFNNITEKFGGKIKAYSEYERELIEEAAAWFRDAAAFIKRYEEMIECIKASEVAEYGRDEEVGILKGLAPLAGPAGLDNFIRGRKETTRLDLKNELKKLLMPENLEFFSDFNSSVSLNAEGDLDADSSLYLISAAVEQLIYNSFDSYDRRDKGDNPIIVDAFRAGSQIVIRVTDKGEGIESPELAAEIFDLGKTTKAGEGGTGLGLALVDAIVDHLGGTIDVESWPWDDQHYGLIDHNTTFTIRLPAAGQAGYGKEFRAFLSSMNRGPAWMDGISIYKYPAYSGNANSPEGSVEYLFSTIINYYYDNPQRDFLGIFSNLPANVINTEENGRFEAAHNETFKKIYRQYRHYDVGEFYSGNYDDTRGRQIISEQLALRDKHLAAMRDFEVRIRGILPDKPECAIVFDRIQYTYDRTAEYYHDLYVHAAELGIEPTPQAKPRDGPAYLAMGFFPWQIVTRNGGIDWAKARAFVKSIVHPSAELGTGSSWLIAEKALEIASTLASLGLRNDDKGSMRAEKNGTYHKGINDEQPTLTTASDFQGLGLHVNGYPDLLKKVKPEKAIHGAFGREGVAYNVHLFERNAQAGKFGYSYDGTNNGPAAGGNLGAFSGMSRIYTDTKSSLRGYYGSGGASIEGQLKEDGLTFSGQHSMANDKAISWVKSEFWHKLKSGYEALRHLILGIFYKDRERSLEGEQFTVNRVPAGVVEKELAGNRGSSGFIDTIYGNEQPFPWKSLLDRFDFAGHFSHLITNIAQIFRPRKVDFEGQKTPPARLNMGFWLFPQLLRTDDRNDWAKVWAAVKSVSFQLSAFRFQLKAWMRTAGERSPIRPERVPAKADLTAPRTSGNAPKKFSVIEIKVRKTPSDIRGISDKYRVDSPDNEAPGISPVRGFTGTSYAKNAIQGVRNDIQKGIFEGLSFTSDLAGAEVMIIGPGRTGAEIESILSEFPGIGALHIVSADLEAMRKTDETLSALWAKGIKVPKVYGYVTNVMELPEDLTGRIDLVFDSYVFETPKYFDQKMLERVEDEISRILKPGGVHAEYLLFLNYVRHGEMTKIKGEPGLIEYHQKADAVDGNVLHHDVSRMNSEPSIFNARIQDGVLEIGIVPDRDGRRVHSRDIKEPVSGGDGVMCGRVSPAINIIEIEPPLSWGIEENRTKVLADYRTLARALINSGLDPDFRLDDSTCIVLRKMQRDLFPATEIINLGRLAAIDTSKLWRLNHHNEEMTAEEFDAYFAAITPARRKMIEETADYVVKAQEWKRGVDGTGRLIVGIEGLDASGKSHFVDNELMPYLKFKLEKKVKVVHGDWCMVDKETRDTDTTVNYDNYYNWFEFKRLISWLDTLRNSQSTGCDINEPYISEKEAREKDPEKSIRIDVDDDTIVLVDGLFLQRDDREKKQGDAEEIVNLRKRFDRFIYFDIEKDMSRSRQVERDQKKMNRPLELVEHYVDDISWPKQEEYIEAKDPKTGMTPIESADIVVDNNDFDSPIARIQKPVPVALAEGKAAVKKNAYDPEDLAQGLIKDKRVAIKAGPDKEFEFLYIDRTDRGINHFSIEVREAGVSNPASYIDVMADSIHYSMGKGRGCRSQSAALHVDWEYRSKRGGPGRYSGMGRSLISLAMALSHKKINPLTGRPYDIFYAIGVEPDMVDFYLDLGFEPYEPVDAFTTMLCFDMASKPLPEVGVKIKDPTAGQRGGMVRRDIPGLQDLARTMRLFAPHNERGGGRRKSSQGGDSRSSYESMAFTSAQKRDIFNLLKEYREKKISFEKLISRLISIAEVKRLTFYFVSTLQEKSTFDDTWYRGVAEMIIIRLNEEYPGGLNVILGLFHSYDKNELAVCHRMINALVSNQSKVSREMMKALVGRGIGSHSARVMQNCLNMTAELVRNNKGTSDLVRIYERFVKDGVVERQDFVIKAVMLAGEDGRSNVAGTGQGEAMDLLLIAIDRAHTSLRKSAEAGSAKESSIKPGKVSQTSDNGERAGMAPRPDPKRLAKTMRFYDKDDGAFAGGAEPVAQALARSQTAALLRFLKSGYRKNDDGYRCHVLTLWHQPFEDGEIPLGGSLRRLPDGYTERIHDQFWAPLHKTLDTLLEKGDPLALGEFFGKFELLVKEAEENVVMKGKNGCSENTVLYAKILELIEGKREGFEKAKAGGLARQLENIVGDFFNSHNFYYGVKQDGTVWSEGFEGGQMNYELQRKFLEARGIRDNVLISNLDFIRRYSPRFRIFRKHGITTPYDVKNTPLGVFEKAVNFLKIKDGDECHDFGCGRGHFMFYIKLLFPDEWITMLKARARVRLQGYDKSTVMVRAARGRYLKVAKKDISDRSALESISREKFNKGVAIDVIQDFDLQGRKNFIEFLSGSVFAEGGRFFISLFAGNGNKDELLNGMLDIIKLEPDLRVEFTEKDEYRAYIGIIKVKASSGDVVRNDRFDEPGSPEATQEPDGEERPVEDEILRCLKKHGWLISGDSLMKELKGTPYDKKEIEQALERLRKDGKIVFSGDKKPVKKIDSISVSSGWGILPEEHKEYFRGKDLLRPRTDILKADYTTVIKPILNSVICTVPNVKGGPDLQLSYNVEKKTSYPNTGRDYYIHGVTMDAGRPVKLGEFTLFVSPDRIEISRYFPVGWPRGFSSKPEAPYRNKGISQTFLYWVAKLAIENSIPEIYIETPWCNDIYVFSKYFADKVKIINPAVPKVEFDWQDLGNALSSGDIYDFATSGKIEISDPRDMSRIVTLHLRKYRGGRPGEYRVISRKDAKDGRAAIFKTGSIVTIDEKSFVRAKGRIVGVAMRSEERHPEMDGTILQIKGAPRIPPDVNVRPAYRIKVVSLEGMPDFRLKVFSDEYAISAEKIAEKVASVERPGSVKRLAAYAHAEIDDGRMTAAVEDAKEDDGIGFKVSLQSPKDMEERHGIIFSDMFKLARPDAIIMGRDWLKEVLAGRMQEQDVKRVLSDIRNFCNRGRKDGEDIFFDLDDEEVAKKLQEIKTRNPNAKVAVLAKESTIAGIENSDEKTIFAAVDNKELLDRIGLDPGEDYYLRVLEMLYVVMDISRQVECSRGKVISKEIIDEVRKKHPELAIELRGGHSIIYRPIAEKFKYKTLKLMYDVKLSA